MISVAYIRMLERTKKKQTHNVCGKSCVFLFIELNLNVTLTKLMCLMSKANVYGKALDAIVMTNESVRFYGAS